MASHAFCKFWLKITAFVIAFFGPALTLATMPGWQEPARVGLDLLSWPIDGVPTYEHNDMRFLSALTGGFLVGWGVMIWGLSVWVYDVAPEGVRRTLLTGLIAWFVFDSAGSVLSGTPANVGFNIVVLLLCVGPMWRPAKPMQTEG